MDKNKPTPITRFNPAGNSTDNQRSMHDAGLLRKTFAICTLVISLALASCGAATSTPKPISSQPPASQPVQTAAPAAATLPPAENPSQNTPAPAQPATPTATSGSQSATGSTSIDPCLLISSDEASKIAGASYGQGKESSTSGGLRMCTYGGQTSNVFTVDVYQAPDVATAKADKEQFLADLKTSMQQLTSEGMNVTELPNFADGATIATANFNVSGITISGGAIGLLKGKTFFGFSDIVQSGQAPTSEALQAEATTVLGRLP